MKKINYIRETQRGNDIFLVQEANNFHLEVFLIDNKLIITLKDFVIGSSIPRSSQNKTSAWISIKKWKKHVQKFMVTSHILDPRIS